MHNLDGPLLKVRCVRGGLERLAECQFDLFKRGDHRAVKAEFDEERGKYAYRVLTDALPPADIGVLIGEIAHNLRSALDGLTWQLALLRTRTPAWNTEFPIYAVGKTDRKRNGRKISHFARDGLRKIRSLRPVHQAAIEALQPYKGGRGFKRHPLWQLHELNNADKHRLLQVVGAFNGVMMMSAARTAEVWPTEVHKAGVEYVFGPLKDGAIVAYIPGNMDAEVELQPGISFAAGCPTVRGLGAYETLLRMTEHVEKIVEGFRPEFG